MTATEQELEFLRGLKDKQLLARSSKITHMPLTMFLDGVMIDKYGRIKDRNPDCPLMVTHHKVSNGGYYTTVTDKENLDALADCREEFASTGVWTFIAGFLSRFVWIKTT